MTVGAYCMRCLSLSQKVIHTQLMAYKDKPWCLLRLSHHKIQMLQKSFTSIGYVPTRIWMTQSIKGNELCRWRNAFSTNSQKSYDPLTPEQKYQTRDQISAKFVKAAFTVCSQKTCISLTRMVELLTVSQYYPFEQGCVYFSVLYIFTFSLNRF